MSLNLSLPRQLERSVLLSSPAPPDVLVLPGIPSPVRTTRACSEVLPSMLLRKRLFITEIIVNENAKAHPCWLYKFIAVTASRAKR